MATKPQKTPPSNQAESASRLVSAEWIGPLPPPGALQQFDSIITNGAERIMVMVEKEQDCRLEIDRRFSKAEALIEVGSRILGAMMFFACLAAAIWSVVVGASWPVTVAFLSVPVMSTAAKLFERSSKR